MVFLGKHHHRHGGTDALVAASAVAHHGNHGSCHTRIAGTTGYGEYAREYSIAHDTASQGTAQCLAEGMTVVLRQSAVRRVLIKVLGFKYEFYVVRACRRGILIHFSQRQWNTNALLAHGAGLFLEKHVTVLPQIYKVRMMPLYYRLGLVFAAPAQHTYEQLVGVVLFKGNLYAPFTDISARLLHGNGIGVAKHFKPQFVPAHNRSQCHSNGKPHHACAGNAHTHGIFQYIQTETEFYTVGNTPHKSRCTRHAQGNGNRFGASYRRHNLTAYQGCNGTSFSICYHKPYIIIYNVSICKSINKT